MVACACLVSLSNRCCIFDNSVDVFDTTPYVEDAVVVPHSTLRIGGSPGYRVAHQCFHDLIHVRWTPQIDLDALGFFQFRDPLFLFGPDPSLLAFQFSEYRAAIPRHYQVGKSFGASATVEIVEQHPPGVLGDLYD